MSSHLLHRPSRRSGGTRRRGLLAAALATVSLATAAPALAHGPGGDGGGGTTRHVPDSAIWRDCRTTLAGVAVTVRASQKTVTTVDAYGGTYARVSFFVRTRSTCGFSLVFSDPAGRVGSGGVADGATRRQGTSTTPIGTYTMTQAFGVQPNPGGALPFHRVVDGDYWVQDNGSAYYNDLRNASQGGFRWWLPSSDPDSSERLQDYPGLYAYAIVVNFNRSPDQRILHRGAGIFVHVRGQGPTGGCVSVSAAEVVTMLRTMQSGDAITITA